MDRACICKSGLTAQVTWLPTAGCLAHACISTARETLQRQALQPIDPALNTLPTAGGDTNVQEPVALSDWLVS